MQHELERRKKELQFLTQEKRTLEHQARNQHQQQKRVETKSSNPWYVSRQNKTPGFSQRQPAATSSTRRFLYKPNENKRITSSFENQPSMTIKKNEPLRKRPAVVTFGNASELGGSFDFDIDVSC